MKHVLTGFKILVWLCLPLLAPGRSTTILSGETAEPHPNQYFVKLCHGISNQEVRALMAELNSVELWHNEKIGLRLWAVKKFPYSCSDGEITDINGHLVRSEKKTSVDDAALNMMFELEETDFEPADTYFEDLKLRGELGANPVRIAILDSGISDHAVATHPVFRTLKGYSGYDYVHDDAKPDDENGHGTQIAGIIYGIVSQLGGPSNITLDIRKTHDFFGLGNISNLTFAIVDAVDAGANIINMSFSYYETLYADKLNPLQLAIDYAEQNGVLVIASAGNNGRNIDQDEAVPVPASLPNENIISVASNGPDETPSPFTNYGAKAVDVSILGEHIPGPGLFGEPFHASGTSFSTAIVSGISAILGTRQAQFNGCEIKCTLISTSKKAPGWTGRNRSEGVIDFRRALNDPPQACAQACENSIPAAELDCGANCPPETQDMDLCVTKGLTVVDKLLTYDLEGDAIAYEPKAVYGPFRGTVNIYPDGSFAYTSFGGERDMFVYQICDNVQTECSDGCSQGVVYINAANCSPPSADGNYTHPAGSDCVQATGEDPKMLTFRYTGASCSASRHAQDDGKVYCLGGLSAMPATVYMTAVGGSDKYYLVNKPVSLNEVISIDAAVAVKDKLESATRITLKDSEGRSLQTIEIHTSGSQPLRVGDQFGSFRLEGYLSKDNRTCGVVDVVNRDVYDCRKDTGSDPRLLTFEYTGSGCGATQHHQDNGKVICSGNPGFASAVYITAVGGNDKYYLINHQVTKGKTFSIDAASVDKNKLESTTTFYLRNAEGTLLQKIDVHTSGSQPLGTGDQFGSLKLKGYVSEHNVNCGMPDIPEYPGDACATTGDEPRVLVMEYTGGGCPTISHNQKLDKVSCADLGENLSDPFVYITVKSGDGKQSVFFRDLQVPLHGRFDIDAASIGKDKFESSVIVILEDADDNVLQQITFETSCSEPLVIGNQFGAVQLKGYLSEKDVLWGAAPVNEVCNPTFGCAAEGDRSAIGLIYIGRKTTSVYAFANKDSKDYCGGYPQVDPGDFILFSSLYRGNNKFGHFFLRWNGSQGVEIPIETSVDILGQVFGDFKVVQQLDEKGNGCRVPYSGCYELNRLCGAADESIAAVAEETDPFQPVVLDAANLQPIPEKYVELFPNPAREVAYLDLTDFMGERLVVELYDQVGRQVRRIELDEVADTLLEMDLKTVADGFYSVLIRPATGDPLLKKLIVTGN